MIYKVNIHGRSKKSASVKIAPKIRNIFTIMVDADSVAQARIEANKWAKKNKITVKAITIKLHEK
jgi:hypothetical protein